MKKGFTLIEVLLGLTISAAIFIAAASLMASILGSSTKSKQIQDIEQTKNDIQTDIGNSARWADTISFVGGQFKTDDTTYHLNLDEGTLYKNDQPLTPSDIFVSSFEVLKYTTVADATDLETGVGLTGQYYDGRNFDELKFTQIDFDVDFDWQYETPNVLLNSDNFSVRWTGQIETPEDSQYDFYTVSDDGVRLWIDNKLVIDNWSDHGATQNHGKIKLDGGKRYDIRMEFYEHAGQAVAKLLWAYKGQSQEIILTSRLYPNASSASIEIKINFRSKLSSSLTDSLDLILSPRGGTVGAIEPAPTPTPTPVPTLPPTPTPDPTPTKPPTPTPIPTPTKPPTPTPKPTEPPTPEPTKTPEPTPKPLR